MNPINSPQQRISVVAVDQVVDRVRKDFNVPGLAVAIVKDDAIVTAKGYGVRAQGNDKPATADSLFGIASISKSFTAMALGILVDEGKLCWNEPVTNYIPSFQLHDAYATREFTVLDLLVHRSGLAPVSGGTAWYGTDYSRNEVIARIRHLQPISSFRSEYAYQNITYLVAGQIIPTMTGMTWDTFVAKRLFAPLGMQTSNTSIGAFCADDNLFQPHVLVNDQLQIVPWRNYDNVGPAASINTTARELANYARLLLNGGVFDGQRLYSAEIADDLWRPHTLRPLAAENAFSSGVHMPRFHSAYALGWGIQDYRGQRRVSHSGGIDGLRSLLTMIPAANLGIIVFTNAEVPAPLALTNFILDLYWDTADADWYAVMRKEWSNILAERSSNAQSIPVSDTIPALQLDEYTGRYHSAMVDELEIRIDNGRLTLIFPHTKSFTAELTHWHYDTFRLNWQDPMIPNGLLTFVFDPQRKIVEIRLDQPNLLDVDFSELHPIKRLPDPLN